MMQCHILEIAFPFNGETNFLYPVVLQNEQHVLLVDCGYAGFLPLLEKALSNHQLSVHQLTGMIITHHDIDHMGAAAELKKNHPALQIYSSAIEAPFISGKQKSLRLIQAEQMLDSIPEEYKTGALQFIELLKGMQTLPVDHFLAFNREVDWLRGIEVIHTPGHMPGHISIYIRQSKTLIAADAVVIENGILEIANPQFTLDLDDALRSVEKLKQLEIDQLICYHGGLMQKDIPGQLEQLLMRYKQVSTKPA
ncbi:MBL fold metallo-hydrolase [Lacibacter sediminis]|uniref:MBL fold metallo-hydrolase n=1 Tax=Lacibacter sediminis TaxID=2760713 RepID=A0A7G5XMM1_9BACT|nr:MBL fold metallo-hydrolase [Lacibacter sediminis]